MSRVSLVSARYRLTAVLVLLLMAPATYASAACAGWTASAADRAACCKRGDGQCASISADACCAGAEQRQHAETVVTVTLPAEASVSRPLPPSAPRWCRAGRAPRALSDRPATYLLDSVFLI